MKIFTAIVIIIMLALIGVTIYLSFQDDSYSAELVGTNNNEVERSQNESEDLPENWQTYANSNFDFTFLYPAGAAESVEAGRAKITVLGADNTANSEVTDGFTFLVRTEDVPEDSSLSEFANQLYSEEILGLESVQEPTERMVSGRLMYEFQVETDLGTTATHVIFESEDNRVFVATYTISDMGENSYQETIDIMLSSVELAD